MDAAGHTSLQARAGRSAALLPALLCLALAACNEPRPSADAGGQPGADAGAPDLDASAPPGPDAGRSCPAGRTACGLNCCDDETETCSGGACLDRGCASSEIPCGRACCNRAIEYCDADNTCQASATCNSRQEVCGHACCDTATSYCALAATSTCGTLAACGAAQTVCGAQCCDRATETCDFAVHACKGPGPTECDPLFPEVCVAAESCQVTATGWECAAAGTAQEGDPCSSDNACAAGLDCLGTLFEAVCYRYCQVGDDEACHGGMCVPAFESGSVGICLCDAVLQLGCSGDDACYFNGLATSCGPAGAGQVGEACADDRDCSRGLSCGFGGTCAAFCNPQFLKGCEASLGGSACINYGDGTGFCGTKCDPLKQDCPDPGQACFASPVAGGFCASPGTTPDGERCSSPTACRKGSNCLRTAKDGDYRCLPACDAAFRGCGNGGTCIALGGSSLGGCVSAQCDPVTQVGCGAGTACYWDAAALAYACLTSGTGPSGSACLADADCAPGLTCFGKCVPYCRPGATPSYCAEAGATCRDWLGTGFGACVVDSCDPRAQDCPEKTDACYPAETGYFCHAPGTVADGLTCADLTDCRKGSTCLGSSQSKQCYRLCDTTAATDLCAATSQTCIAVSGPLGVCY